MVSVQSLWSILLGVCVGALARSYHKFGTMNRKIFGMLITPLPQTWDTAKGIISIKYWKPIDLTAQYISNLNLSWNCFVKIQLTFLKKFN